MTNIKLTPLEQARLKLIDHVAIIAGLNGLLSALSYLGSLAIGAPVNWSLFIVIVLSQVVLAVLDSAKEYFTAKGNTALSELADMARQEVAAKTPQPVYNAQQKAVQSAISSLYDSSTTSTATTPTTSNNGIVATPAQQTTTVQHTNIEETPIFSTLPEINAVKPA